MPESLMPESDKVLSHLREDDYTTPWEAIRPLKNLARSLELRLNTAIEGIRIHKEATTKLTVKYHAALAENEELRKDKEKFNKIAEMLNQGFRFRFAINNTPPMFVISSPNNRQPDIESMNLRQAIDSAIQSTNNPNLNQKEKE